MTPEFIYSYRELLNQRAKEALRPLPHSDMFSTRNEWIDKQFELIGFSLVKLQEQIDSLKKPQPSNYLHSQFTTINDKIEALEHDRDTHKEMYASFEHSLISVRDMVEVIMKMLKALVDNGKV